MPAMRRVLRRIVRAPGRGGGEDHQGEVRVPGRQVDRRNVRQRPSSSVRLVLSDGRNLTLPQAMSASGARYANKDESIVFWNKGDTAFLEENGRTTYEGCTARA
jgi:hypothetical protein